MWHDIRYLTKGPTKFFGPLLRRQRTLFKRIKLPDDLYSAATEGAWLKVPKCPLPEYIEGRAKGTHKLINGTLYRLVPWDELEDTFPFKNILRKGLKLLTPRGWTK